MAEVTDVTIADGVPTVGTGTVPTLSKTNTVIGGVTETAPATDTASSGLNGRLQRVAQRITSLIALLPAALGAGGGLKVDGSGTALPVSVADGSNVAIGAKADAAWSSGDGTVVALLKTVVAWVSRIYSSTMPAAAGAATATTVLGVGGTFHTTPATDTTDTHQRGLEVDSKGNLLTGSPDGADVTIGITTGAAVVTDANGTLQQYLRGLVKLFAAAVGAAATAFFVKVTDGTDTLLVDTHGSAQAVIMDAAGNAVTYDIGVKPMNFAAAATQLVRPANVTAYAVLDSVSNNTTAGSVTALSASVSDTNDAPVNLTHISLATNDTGIGMATVSMRVYVYNADPTASTGVVGGDNAVFSNKQNGLVATFVGTFVAMSDGGKCNCVPESGAPYVVCKPTSGAKTLFVQHQIIGGTPTPSANSTTIDTTLCGFQGRAT